MHIKYVRNEETPPNKSEWLNSSIRIALEAATIRINKDPPLSRLLSGIMEPSDCSYNNTPNSIFHTKSVFATNIPSYSVFPSKPTIRKRMFPSGKIQKEQAVITCFAPRRTQSQKRIRGLSQDGLQKMKYKKINEDKLKQMIVDAKSASGRVINVLCIVKNGLRYNLKQTYVIMEDENSNDKSAKQLKQNIKSKLQLEFKNMYLFHLNRQPISKVVEIHSSEYSIFVDRSPKLEIPIELYSQMNDQIKILEGKIKHIEEELSDGESDGENIIDIGEYADQLILNPNGVLEINTNETKKYQNKKEEFKNIIKWYDQGISQSNKKLTTKDLPEQTVDERSDQVVLKQTRMQLESFPYIKNPHKYKLTTDQIRQKSYQRKVKSKSQSKIALYVNNIKTSKEVNRELIKKHPLLSSQNIPYLMQKYNSSRSDVHHLYNLYKALAQISAKRIRSSSQLTVQRGIDIKTFSQGLAGIGYNIGKQVVKTVCNFQEFVSWPQFLKIVSISASKTPEQKLQSILKYVSEDSNSEYLSKLQVDIMVTTCLSKFLGKSEEEDFIEMKQYLLDAIFKQLDPRQQGKIKIQVLKERVLREGRENDLISFLFLYSD